MTRSLSIAVVDYEGGNLASAARAAARAAELSGLEASVRITSSPADVRTADRIICPVRGRLLTAPAGSSPSQA